MEMERRGQVQAPCWRQNQQDRLMCLNGRGGRGTIKEVVSLARMPFSEQRAAGGGRDVALGRGTEN